MHRPKLPLFIAIVAWLLASPLVVAVATHAAWLPRLDAPVVAWMLAHRTPSATAVLLALTQLGNPPVMTAITAVVCLLLLTRRQWASASFLAVAVGGLSLLNHLIKQALQRPRPFIADPAITPLVHAGGYSFPSGHATAAMLFCGGLWLLLTTTNWRPWLRVACHGLLLLLLLGIGYSRIYAQVHYPTDVLAGYLIALGGLQLLWWLWWPWLHRRV